MSLHGPVNTGGRPRVTKLAELWAHSSRYMCWYSIHATEDRGHRNGNASAAHLPLQHTVPVLMLLLMLLLLSVLLLFLLLLLLPVLLLLLL